MLNTRIKYLPYVGTLLILIVAQAFAFSASQVLAAYSTTITNFNAAGNQVLRFDVAGNSVDAHDGDLALFAGTYYLYGTSYNCGFQWQASGAPFCGFKVYSSPDLVHWTDRGALFDASTATWQTRCNGNTSGCYRPHVIYNASTGLYVLWINSYDNSSSFHVFTSGSPTGPFTEVAEPVLAYMGTNGDHDTFVDNDGSAYLAYTAILAGNLHIEVIERLNASYTSGTGAYVVADSNSYGAAGSEAPSLFRNGSTYYLVYGPTCPYCGGIATIYKTATNPLGPWSANATTINANSCGGQPSFVAVIPTSNGTAYLYGSDLWNNGAKNEALANYFWTPLSFSGASIQSFSCSPTVSLNLATGSAGSQLPVTNLDQHAGVAGFRSWSDIGPNFSRIQTFEPSRTGLLTSASLTTFQLGAPNAGLTLDLVAADASFQPIGSPLYTITIPAGSIGWSPRSVTIYPNVVVTAGSRYGILARSTTTSGSYGWTFNDNAPYPSGGSAYKTTGSWTIEANRTLKFQTTVSTGPAGYTFCAAENGTCSFSGTASVAYGANGLFNYGTYTNTVSCTNAVFGDPIPGMAKACYYRIGSGSTLTPTRTNTPGPTPTRTPTPVPGGWTYCAAAESGTCSFSGTMVVRYGANTSYFYRTVTGSIACNQTAFGGDPIFGTLKHCDYSPQPPNNGWTLCAAENGTCSFSGTRAVAYGANGTFFYRTATTSISCTNAVFGDPIPNTVKACYYK